MQRLSLILFAFACLLITKTNAQRNKFTGWLFNTHNIKLNSKFSVQFDNQFRTTDNWESADVDIVRTGITMELKKGYAVAAGYIFVDSWKTIDKIRDNISEKRLWQQIQFSKQYKKVSFQQRIRIEERWLPVVGVRNNRFYKQDENINTRVRYWSRWVWPFSNKMNFQKGFYGSLQDEFIFNATGARHNNKMFFDQTRVCTGVGYRFSKIMDIEAGHMFVIAINKEKKSIITNAIQITTILKL